MNARTCRSCGASIFWTLTERGARMPVDELPVDDGTIEVYASAFAGSVGLSRVLSGDSLTAARAAGAPLHRSHFASCPNANEWRRPRAKAHA